MRGMSIDYADAAARERCHELGWLDAERAIADGRGFTVRCTPHRRTTCFRGPDGTLWFKKLRSRSPREARAEWRWLHELRNLGLVPVAPICVAVAGRDSLLVTRAAPGVAMDAWLVRHAGEQRACRAAAEQAGGLVRELHRLGLCYRDLYWNHLFRDDQALVLLDVERVFAPRWRKARWIRKDLAGLAASMPAAAASATFGARVLRAYLGGALAPGWKGLARRVLAKAARIRAHRPKFG